MHQITCIHCNTQQTMLLEDCVRCGEFLTEACEDETCGCHERLPVPPGDLPGTA